MKGKFWLVRVLGIYGLIMYFINVFLIVHAISSQMHNEDH